jgi:hypothetical protein
LEGNGDFGSSLIDVYDLSTADYEPLACQNCHHAPGVERQRCLRWT